MAGVRETVDRMWSAIEAHDLEAVGALVSDDVDFRFPGVEMRGREQLLGFIKAYLEGFPDLHHETVDAVESGGAVAVELRVTGTHTGTMVTPEGDLPATGKQVVWESVDLVKVVDDQVTSWHAYTDRVAFMTQLGLMPESASA